MKLGSLVTYSGHPGQLGVFNGFSENAGRKMASVKFPGKRPIQVPADLVAPAIEKRKTGPKPKLRRLSPEKYAVLLNEHGITPERAHEQAIATGSTLDEVFEAYTEICPAK